MAARENATVSGSEEDNAGSREKILTIKQFVDGSKALKERTTKRFAAPG